MVPHPLLSRSRWCALKFALAFGFEDKFDTHFALLCPNQAATSNLPYSVTLPGTIGTATWFGDPQIVNVSQTAGAGPHEFPYPINVTATVVAPGVYQLLPSSDLPYVRYVASGFNCTAALIVSPQEGFACYGPNGLFARLWEEKNNASNSVTLQTSNTDATSELALISLAFMRSQSWDEVCSLPLCPLLSAPIAVARRRTHGATMLRRTTSIAETARASLSVSSGRLWR